MSRKEKYIITVKLTAVSFIINFNYLILFILILNNNQRLLRARILLLSSKQTPHAAVY